MAMEEEATKAADISTMSVTMAMEDKANKADTEVLVVMEDISTRAFTEDLLAIKANKANAVKAATQLLASVT